VTKSKRDLPPVDWTGQTFTVKIEKVAHGGIFVARHEGRVVFVSHVLPGETASVRVVEDKGGAFCRAEPLEILEASADRVPQVWKAAGPGIAGGAGGCEFGHIKLSRQRELKSDVLEEALSRMAGIERRVEVEALAGDDEANGLGYRTRVQLKVDAAGVAGPVRERSHEVVEVRDLPLAVDEIRELGLHQKNWQDVERIEIAASNTGQMQWMIDKKVKGDERLIERVAGRTFRISAGGFWQVHKKAAETLTTCVNDMIAAGGLDLNAPNLDLYGGVGLFAGAIAAKFANRVKITTVESSKQATKDAEMNLADLPAVRAVCKQTDGFLAEQISLAKSGTVDFTEATVILDPPRSGAGGKVVNQLLKLKPKQIVYVACDPIAVARDLKPLLTGGFKIASMRAFDLFPHTHHFETVVHLQRV
jgi:tRNA/tmRNA/rRNA uracil-C5-methylase (TrmA/RlmC/RlmD family)